MLLQLKIIYSIYINKCCITLTIKFNNFEHNELNIPMLY